MQYSKIYPLLNPEKNSDVKIDNDIYIINYDENCRNKKKLFKYDVEKYMAYLNNYKPSIIIICTQNSFSGGEEHFQHYMKNNILNIFNDNHNHIHIDNDYNNVKKYPQYLLFSKIDSIRPINSSNPFIDKCGLRTRIYINISKVSTLLDLKKFSEKSSQSITSYTNEFTATKNTEKVEGNIKPIVIEQYKYRRITSETNGRKGIGSIMISMVLKKNGILTQYIICNYNVKKQNNSIEENTFNNMLKLHSNIGDTSSINIYYISIGKIYNFTYQKDEFNPKKYVRINHFDMQIKKKLIDISQSKTTNKNVLFEYKNLEKEYLVQHKNSKKHLETIYELNSKNGDLKGPLNRPFRNSYTSNNYERNKMRLIQETHT